MKVKYFRDTDTLGAYERAYQLATNDVERRFLARRLEEVGTSGTKRVRVD